MEITNAQQAEVFVRAWSAEAPTRQARFFRIAGEAMAVNASLATHYGRTVEAADYRAAGVVLASAERAVLAGVSL